MATINSNLVTKKMRHRGIYSGKPYEVSGRIFLAAGTVLVAGDILLGVPVGENQRIKEVTVMAVGDTGAAAGSVGYFQILDKNGDPARVERLGHYSVEQSFVSPASSPAAYRAAAQLDGYVRTEVTTADLLTGPVNIGIAVTTGGTVGVDTELYIGASFDGETSIHDTMGGGSDNAYLLDPIQGTEQTP